MAAAETNRRSGLCWYSGGLVNHFHYGSHDCIIHQYGLGKASGQAGTHRVIFCFEKLEYSGCVISQLEDPIHLIQLWTSELNFLLFAKNWAFSVSRRPRVRDRKFHTAIKVPFGSPKTRLRWLNIRYWTLVYTTCLNPWTKFVRNHLKHING